LGFLEFPQDFLGFQELGVFDPHFRVFWGFRPFLGVLGRFPRFFWVDWEVVSPIKGGFWGFGPISPGFWGFWPFSQFWSVFGRFPRGFGTVLGPPRISDISGSPAPIPGFWDTHLRIPDFFTLPRILGFWDFGPAPRILGGSPNFGFCHFPSFWVLDPAPLFSRFWSKTPDFGGPGFPGFRGVEIPEGRPYFYRSWKTLLFPKKRPENYC